MIPPPVSDSITIDGQPMSLGSRPFCTHLDSEDLKLQRASPPEVADYGKNLSADQTFRHGCWERDRARVMRAMGAVFPSSKRYTRFWACGQNAFVMRSEDDPDRYRVASDHCHDRFCRPCAGSRGRTIAANVAAYIGKRRYRFLTLTIKTTDLTLKQGIDKLYRSFGLLRRSKLWQARVTGGVAVCEVKPGKSHDGWHPHLHCIIEGKFLPYKVLRALWMGITKDSFILDIRPGGDAESAAYYICKYITKPFTSETIRTESRLEEAIHALHGRRVITTFGSWRGKDLTGFQNEETWRIICPLATLRDRVNAGDDEARMVWDALKHTDPNEHLPLQRDGPNALSVQVQCSPATWDNVGDRKPAEHAVIQHDVPGGIDAMNEALLPF